MATKWFTKLEVTQKRCPIVLQGHPSNSKVTRAKKSTILTRIECFRTVTLVWIHRWLQNDAQSLKWHRWCALLFFEVIRHISRSQGPKTGRFGSNLRVSGWQLQFEFMDGYEITYRASRSMEEVPYCFSGAGYLSNPRPHGLKNRFGSHLRLQSRSQLLNPSDLPCFMKLCVALCWFLSYFTVFVKEPRRLPMHREFNGSTVLHQPNCV